MLGFLRFWPQGYCAKSSVVVVVFWKSDVTVFKCDLRYVLTGRQIFAVSSRGNEQIIPACLPELVS